MPVMAYLDNSRGAQYGGTTVIAFSGWYFLKTQKITIPVTISITIPVTIPVTIPITIPLLSESEVKNSVQIFHQNSSV